MCVGMYTSPMDAMGMYIKNILIYTPMLPVCINICSCTAIVYSSLFYCIRVYMRNLKMNKEYIVPNKD